MPELPEVETIVRGLSKHLPGLRVQRMVCSRRDIFRRGSMHESRMAGSKITGVERAGKNIIIRLQPKYSMVVNLGMTGRLIFTRDSLPPPGANEKHLHARLVLTRGGELRFYDARRFGSILITSHQDIAALLEIGKDPFEITTGELRMMLKGRRTPIKSFLLNQKYISGLGNIYIDETLFRAGVHPLIEAQRASAQAGKVLTCARTILRRAIENSGTTLRDFRTHDGSSGSFQKRLLIYGREGTECRRCGTTIEKIRVAGRGTHVCPKCQRL